MYNFDWTIPGKSCTNPVISFTNRIGQQISNNRNSAKIANGFDWSGKIVQAFDWPKFFLLELLSGIYHSYIFVLNLARQMIITKRMLHLCCLLSLLLTKRTHENESTAAAEIVMYEGIVPKNVRDIIYELSSLEKTAFRKGKERL